VAHITEICNSAVAGRKILKIMGLPFFILPLFRTIASSYPIEHFRGVDLIGLTILLYRGPHAYRRNWLIKSRLLIRKRRERSNFLARQGFSLSLFLMRMILHSAYFAKYAECEKLVFPIMKDNSVPIMVLLDS